MLETIIIVLEHIPRVERRIDIHALHLASELLFECFKGKEVIGEDEAGVEEVGPHPLPLSRGEGSVAELGVVALFEVFQEDAGFELGALVLAD
ncbi:MAG: hypothetical protein JST38_02690, partial [Bacteroidetes bacterium]|nr:hypothetical protein [Bacteroidota bacterium]